MRIKLLFVFATIMITACSTLDNNISTNIPNIDMGLVYSAALDSFMDVDIALNDGINYIAIDTHNMKNLVAGDEEKMIQYLQKYNVDVFISTYEQLLIDGYADSTTQTFKGVLLVVETTKLERNKMTIEGFKSRSGDGSTGIRVIVEFKGDEWKVTKTEQTWVS